jgi:hypothetical protein
MREGMFERGFSAMRSAHLGHSGITRVWHVSRNGLAFVGSPQQAPYDSSVSSSVVDDPRRLAEGKAKEIAALSWEELDAYDKREEEVVAASGQRFRVTSQTFWDMEDWASMMYVIVKVYPPHGWRRFWGYSAVETRGDSDDDPIPERPT